MKNSGKFQNSMRAVTINSEFSLPGLSLMLHRNQAMSHDQSRIVQRYNYTYQTFIKRMLE